MNICWRLYFWFCLCILCCGRRTQGLPVLQIHALSPIVAIVGTDVRLSCSAMQWAATEGYTITWSRNNTGEVLSKNLHVVADLSKYAVTTVTSSELESTTWTLTIKDAAQTDGGDYTCSLKTEPPQFSTVTVIMQTPVISDIPDEVIRWDVKDCCRGKSFPIHCMPMCDTMVTGFDVYETLRVSDQCRPYHDPWFRCLASDRNHVPCCKRRYVPDKCLDLCVGNFSVVFGEGNLHCLHFVGVIFKCFHDGRESIPSPPRNIRVSPLGSDSLRISWSPPLKHGKEMNYTVFYQEIGTGGTKAVSTVALGLVLAGLVPGELYKVHVIALNTAGSSQSSEAVLASIPKSARLVNADSSQNFESPSRSPTTTMSKTVVTSTSRHGLSFEAGNVMSKESTAVTIQPTLVTNSTILDGDLAVFSRCMPHEFATDCWNFIKEPTRKMGNRNGSSPGCRDTLLRFIRCAADGGDHRKCCARNAVSDRCLDYCNGKPAVLAETCPLYLPRILNCFKEGAMFLTSQPTDVSVEYRDAHISIQWRSPEVNSEMVDNYVITMTDSKSGTQSTRNLTVSKDSYTALIDPAAFNSEFLVYIQAESFHGLSRKSAAVTVNLDELTTNYQKNVQTVSANSVGPVIAIVLSLSGIGLVLGVLSIGYWLRRRRQCSMCESTGHSVCTSAEQLTIGGRLAKPINAFYIPGYFGRRGVSQKSASVSSGSYATSFSVRPASYQSDPVYSDVSGAYLWMFGQEEKERVLPIRFEEAVVERSPCSRHSSNGPNIYDCNLPL